jgi:predicted DsbA family dithiol-disulfide isomerase
VPFPLHPDTPPEGLDLKAYLKSRGIDPKASFERLAGLMKAEGLPYAERDRTSQSRLAQELATWAVRQGVFAIHDALFRAYFVDGKNIGDLETLVSIAESVGLSGDEARRVLVERTEKAAVDGDWQRVRAMGVTGVPTFVANGYGVVGAQPYEVLEKLVEEAGGVRR